MKFWPVLIMGAALAAPAFAQETSTQEMQCIRAGLNGKEVVELVETYLKPTPEKMTSVDKALDRVRTQCVARYKWNEAQADHAEDIALHVAILDVLGADLGLNPKLNTNTVLNVWSTLPTEEATRFFKTDWNQDGAFVKKLDERLLAAGLENNRQVLSKARTMLESAALSSALANSWPGK